MKTGSILLLSNTYIFDNFIESLWDSILLSSSFKNKSKFQFKTLFLKLKSIVNFLILQTSFSYLKIEHGGNLYRSLPLRGIENTFVLYHRELKNSAGMIKFRSLPLRGIEQILDTYRHLYLYLTTQHGGNLYRSLPLRGIENTFVLYHREIEKFFCGIK